MHRLDHRIDHLVHHVAGMHDFKVFLNIFSGGGRVIRLLGKCVRAESKTERGNDKKVLHDNPPAKLRETNSIIPGIPALSLA